MKKKIAVLTVRLTVHIPHKLGDALSLHDVTDAIEGLRRYAADLGETTVDTRPNRVPAPEPAGDGLDIPPALVRTGTAK